jgi:hypothetical protein
MFERLAIDIMRDFSIQAACKHLRLSWDEAPTLAAVVGCKPLSGSAGHILTEVVER